MTINDLQTLSTGEAADALGLAPSTLAKLRLSGLGPAYLKLGRRVRYRVADLNTYMQARLRRSTSEDAAK
jgi:hypothetical protein